MLSLSLSLYRRTQQTCHAKNTFIKSHQIRLPNKELHTNTCMLSTLDAKKYACYENKDVYSVNWTSTINKKPVFLAEYISMVMTTFVWYTIAWTLKYVPSCRARNKNRQQQSCWSTSKWLYIAFCALVYLPYLNHLNEVIDL